MVSANPKLEYLDPLMRQSYRNKMILESGWQHNNAKSRWLVDYNGIMQPDKLTSFLSFFDILLKRKGKNVCYGEKVQ